MTKPNILWTGCQATIRSILTLLAAAYVLGRQARERDCVMAVLAPLLIVLPIRYGRVDCSTWSLSQALEEATPPTGDDALDEEEEEFIGDDALDFEEALAAPDDVQQDPYYFVRTYKTARGDVWHASRIGDTARVRYRRAPRSYRLANAFTFLMEHLLRIFCGHSALS